MDYGQNGTPDYPRYLWQNSVNTWQWGNKVTIALGQSSLPSEALYNFEKITLLDDAVYTMLGWIKRRDIKSKKHRFLNSYKNPMFYCILKTNLF